MFEEDLFETVWKSDSIEVKDKGKEIGKMHFKVYKSKNSWINKIDLLLFISVNLIYKYTYKYKKEIIN